MAEYQRLVEQREQLRRDGPGSEVDEALVRLRPGDIVQAGRKHGTVVVVQRGSGRGGSPRVTALDTGGRSLRLGASSFRRPPTAVGHVELPEPHRPKNPGFRKEVVRRLRRADTQAGSPGRSQRAERLQALDTAIDAHPVAGCPELQQHLDALRRIRSLEREERRAQERVEARADTLSRHLDRVLGLLEDRGYVGDWLLTERGERLCRIYTETDLLISEALHEGLFDDLDPPGVAAIASLFTYEERGPEGSAPPPRWPTSDVARRAHRVEDLSRDLAVHEERAGLPVTRSPDGGFADMAYQWTAGRELDDVLDEDDSGGDFVRNVKQLNDLLHQIAEVAPSPTTRRAARRAAEDLFRGVVEASARVGT